MSYKFTTGSVRSGDIRYEDDGDQTYIDFGEQYIRFDDATSNYTKR